MTIHEKAAIGFDRAGDSYEKGRPEYPQEAVDYLADALLIQPSSKIIDLGAGTGKFTKFLLPLEATILAIEPVEGMRKKFHSLYPDVKVINGSAENIPVEDAFADALFAAQSFHWFNGPLALKEIHRVLKTKGKLGLVWNTRDEAIDWVSRLTQIIDPHEGGAPRYKSMNWKKAFDQTVLFSPLQQQHFSYIQTGVPETIVDRIGSISFISALSQEQRDTVLNEVRDLIRNHPDTKGKSEIKLPYRTDVYWCEKIE